MKRPNVTFLDLVKIDFYSLYAPSPYKHSVVMKFF